MAGVWGVFTIAGALVALVVYGLIFWCLFAYRRRSEVYPAQFKQNAPLEIAYTVVPLLMVAGLFWLTYHVEADVERVSASPAQVVKVTAFRWNWRFDYPRAGASFVGTFDRPAQLVMPAGQATRIELTSADVNHAFWIPAFLFKRDAIAGTLNRFDLTPQHAGEYRGECAEFCGLDHAYMTFKVRVLSPQAFSRWLAGHGRKSSEGLLSR